MNIESIANNIILQFLTNIFDQLISTFSNVLADIMGTAMNVLELSFVQNGIRYSQYLALAILAVKVMNEVFQTYILWQNGDPDADPGGVLIRTAQAVAVIVVLPEIIQILFTFGTKLANDVAALSVGTSDISDWGFLINLVTAVPGVVTLILVIIIVIMLIFVAIQAGIRGAELALLAVVGSIMALNLSSNNRNIWSTYFKQLIIICTTQAVQLFMIKGSFSIISTSNIANPISRMIICFGWIWITIKTPKLIQQVAHSTGFSGAVGGALKQTGSMVMIRKMMAR